MKTWLITLPFLCAVGVAFAQDKAPAPDAAQPEAAAAPAAAEPAKPMRHKAKRLPKGDLRHCLELKGNEAVIRCAETGRKH